MEARLVMFKTSGQKKEILLNQETTTVGRGGECDIRIPIEMCSREHCELKIDGEQLSVKDLGSANGTFVNNERISEALLQPGDRLTIGPVALVVRIDGEPAEIAPPAPAETPAASDSGDLVGDSDFAPTEASDETDTVDPLAMAPPETPDDDAGSVDPLALAATEGGDEAAADPLAALEALVDSQDEEEKQD